MSDWLNVLRALADPTRLRLVKVLLEGPAGVNDLADRLGITQYNASRHLKVLRQAKIVEVKAQGTRREQSIASEHRERIAEQGNVLDIGCCAFRFDQMAEDKPRRAKKAKKG